MGEEWKKEGKKRGKLKKVGKQKNKRKEGRIKWEGWTGEERREESREKGLKKE